MSYKNEKWVYFRDEKDYLKCMLINDHRYIIWKYLKLLRKEENASSSVTRLFWQNRKNKFGNKIGFTIGANTCGENIHLWHIGNIVINGYAKLGKNCILHGNNCIGNNGKDIKAPKIGDNVDIGVGAIIIGDVEIADNIVIAAGAVVNKSFTEKNITIGGVPARKLK